jgi:hypothetical protein
MRSRSSARLARWGFRAFPPSHPLPRASQAGCLWTTKVNEIIRAVYVNPVHKSGTYKAYLGKVRLVSQKVLNREILVDIAVFDKAKIDGLSGTCIILNLGP